MICLRLRKISIPTTSDSKGTAKRSKMRMRTKIAKTAAKKTTMMMPVEAMAVDLAIMLAEIMLAVPANLASNFISLKREQGLPLFYLKSLPQ